jgi:Ca2+-binding RTX toxin-like protein
LGAGLGDDDLFGGAGKDTLIGGRGLDEFYFESASESVGANMDIITDFNFEDRDYIALSEIDANTTNAIDDDTFKFIGVDAFTAAGQLRVVKQGLNTRIDMSTDGDTAAEMSILLLGVKPGELSVTDFAL